MIKIGHSAYQGANALAFASSKSEAVEILRARGVKRDVARAALTLALSKDYGSTVVMGGVHGHDVVEITNMGEAVNRIEGETARQIINRNAKRALRIFRHLKAIGCRPTPTWVAHRILHERIAA